MKPHLEPNSGRSQTGFTLVELIIVIVVLGIMSAYAVMKGSSPAVVTLPSQAQKLASDIRHAQTLAYTMGQRMRVTKITTSSYSVSCTPTLTCNQSQDSSVISLEKGVTFTSGTDTLDFTSLGQPLTSASYTLDNTLTVCVAALTGFVSVISSGTCP